MSGTDKRRAKRERNSMVILQKVQTSTLLFLNKNIVFSAQAEYSYFSADFRLKVFLYYS